MPRRPETGSCRGPRTNQKESDLSCEVMTDTTIIYRIRFTKKGDLRYISHHDMMRLWERAVRRADLPVEMSQGFNPRPKMSYPIALELGVAGLDEVFDVRLTQWLRPAAVRTRLLGVLPPDVAVKSVRTISRRDPTQVAYTCYRVRLLPEHRLSQPVLDRLMSRKQIMATRVRRGKTVDKDVRPFVRAMRLTAGDELEMLLDFTPTGTARPTEILDALGCERGKDYLINRIARLRVAFVSPN